MLSDAQKLFEIPDSSLAKDLAKQGFMKDGYLNPAKVNGQLQLTISNSNIRSLKGLENFKQVWSLDCSSNDLENLDYLPPNLTYLNCYKNKIQKLANLPESLLSIMCSYNLIREINNLPVGLRYLNCHNNLITKITKLPPGLLSLDIQNNKMTYLPKLPSTLQSINYCKNPIPKSKLPVDFRTFNCNSPNQNCLPYGRMKWGILNNNFGIMDSIDSFYIVIYTGTSWGGGNLEENIGFSKEGKYEVSKCVSNRLTNRTAGDSFFQTETNIIIRTDSLLRLLKRIKNGNMYFLIKDGITVDTINLRKKKNADHPTSFTSCEDCNGYYIEFKYCINYKEFVCSYRFDDSQPPLGFPNEMPYLKRIMDWLYFYELAKLCLPPEHEINKNHFTSEYLQRVVDWSKGKN